MLIGYARVSTIDQNAHLQLDALKKAGCEPIITDHVSGAARDRPGLFELMTLAKPGDTIVVWRLDRFGRTLGDLIKWITELQNADIGFRSLQETIDTTTSSGRLIFHIFGALCEFERSVIRERTMAGLASARARGRVGGRPPKLPRDRAKTLVRLYHSGKYSTKELCTMTRISRSTLYAYVRAEDPAPTPPHVQRVIDGEDDS